MLRFSSTTSASTSFRVAGMILSMGCAMWGLALSGCGRGDAARSATVFLDDTVAVEAGGEPDPIANPAARPGGTYTTWGGPTPKSLNMWLDYNSFSANVMGLLFENLVSLHATEDRPVGVLAESWEISRDGRTFTFRIDPRARWSDGRPVTSRDVQFFYDVMMNPAHMTPIFRVGLRRFDRPETPDSLTVRITAREAHWSNFWEAAGLVAFPAHAWEGKDFNDINFDFPVVSGPYKLGEVKRERYITLERRADWWGRAKRYNQHKYNFANIRFRFMEDRNKALEAFKKGDFDVYPVYTASLWAEQTDFEQVRRGWVARKSVYNHEPKGFQGFAINLRNPMFQDVRVREALARLLNRELMNEKLMYNQYFLLNSYYPDLYPGNVNPDAPVLSYDPERAGKLLAEAGWKPGPDGILAKDGRRFTVTFLVSTTDLRHYNVYLEDLKKAGIDAKVEQMSHATVRRRLDNHEFDLYWVAWGAGRLRDPQASWESATADEPASNNIAGVKDRVVDELIEAQKTEMDLGRRNAILRKLDDRLTALMPYVLLWQSDNTRLLYWNRFGTPRHVLDKYNREDAIIPYWFVDAEKERALQARETMPVDTAAARYAD